jgi:hypothetical protein
MKMSTPSDEAHEDARPAATAVLDANHRAFLLYLEHRFGSRTAAEKIPQDAFVRTLDRTRSPTALVIPSRAAQRDHRPEPARVS